ncbi:DUF6701 domain-containing protein [uncultured Vibrio sp.]|uniref:DUF6701 domain-containing protein n=1 Tax=uncultured Vibrio sp. TaxID=114054 RepID=UPI000917EDB7|nr:DUF6701 domain-containing protein [uncultured Vibrio sp.]OIQ24856.1 MAG: hypothetical protein BM561_08185 [Vibrio sp. MedPE-SWchi]
MFMKCMNNIVAWFVLILCSTYVFAEARFPVSDDNLPQTAAQTWGSLEPKVEIKSGTQITTLSGDQKLGYKKIETNKGSCDSKKCKTAEDIRLGENPNFNTPSDAITISINGNITLPRDGDAVGSVYEVSGETKLDGKTLTLTAPTTLYTGTFTVQSGANINPGGDPNNLVIITTGDATIQGSTVNAHIFSNQYLKIDGGIVNGTITTNELLIDASGTINGVNPAPSPATCAINGNNQDFAVEFDVVGSTSYQDVVFSGGNESDTLWYTQEEKSGSDYVFNEQSLATGQSYKLRVEVERGQGNSISRAHYYWVVNGSKVWQESKDADLKNGTITGTGVGLDALDCFEEDVSPPTYSNDAQFEFGTKQCASMPCTIDFTKDYNFAPLVFVMPTVDSVSPDDEKPATLFISSIPTSQSTSVIVNTAVASVDYADDDYIPPNTVAMTEISYLIIEPGVADFDGHEVIAGYVDTDITKSATDSDNGVAIVPFSDFGRQSDFDDPVVLHQIQTRNNGTQWQTSGKVYSNSESDRNQQVRLYLELSNTGSGNYNNERIAFLATDEEDGLLVQGYKIEFSKDFSKPRQGTNFPLNKACNDFEETDLEAIDGVIAKKQQRAGQDGGWTRRCQIDEDNFSVVIDEDSSDRTHVPEEIGYFAFESHELELDLCTYFPEPVQSWKNDGELNLRSSGITIEGWSEEFESAYLSGSELVVAFEGTENNNSEYHLAESCVTSQGTVDCVLKTGSTPPLADTPLSVAPTWGTLELTVSNDNFDSICSGLSECETETIGGQRVLTIKESLESLTVSAYGQSIQTVFEAKAGIYGISIEEYVSDGAVYSYFEANSSYTFGEFSYSGSGATFSVETGVVIIIEDSYSHSNAVPFYDVDGTRDLIFYGPDAELTFRAQDGSDVIAQILADKVEFTNLAIVRGAITTNNLIFNVSGSQVIGEGACLTPPPSSTYEIVLTPPIDIALTCDDISLIATVYKDGVVYSTYSGDVTLSVSGQSDVTVAASAGIANFDLSYTQVSNITATAAATIDGENYDDSGSYEFVPYLYELSANPLQVIAGKSQSFTIRPMECSSNGSPISSTDYTGVKTLDLSAVIYSSPSSPANSAAISLLNSNDDWVDSPTTGTANFSTNFELVNGEVVASSGLIYPESGEISYSLSGEQCINDENGDPICKTFSGSQTVQSRPWTFAICSDDDISGNATDSTSTRYQASGTSFATTVRPIIWQDVTAIDPIETSGYCNATVTQNFFVTAAPSAIVEMTHQVDTPSGGSDGALSGVLIRNHNDKSADGDYYDFDALSWDEVGSVRLLVDTQSTYLGMDINQGYRNVGRFYPAFFNVIDTRWDYPGSMPHVYMGQPFDGVEFDVEALNNAGEAVENYSNSNYADSLQAQFNLFEDSGFATRFVSPDFSTYDWNLTSGSSLGTFTNAKANDCSDSICWAKQVSFAPDGPFNAAEAIEDSTITIDGTVSVTNIDPIAYTTDGAVLTDQPDIRFGRINLNDVGGNQGVNITVPLTVEYWNGSRFIANTDDSSTNFDGTDYCHQVIWSDLTGNAILTGSDTVEFGESQTLSASQNASAREQIRYWLTLHSTDGTNSESDDCSGGDNGLSWLRYNWDGEDSDEEDPSTVVTFGIHRGNDRVIYRGESGLTGQ